MKKFMTIFIVIQIAFMVFFALATNLTHKEALYDLTPFDTTSEDIIISWKKPMAQIIDLSEYAKEKQLILFYPDSQNKTVYLTVGNGIFDKNILGKQAQLFTEEPFLSHCASTNATSCPLKLDNPLNNNEITLYPLSKLTEKQSSIQFIVLLDGKKTDAEALAMFLGSDHKDITFTGTKLSTNPLLFTIVIIFLIINTIWATVFVRELYKKERQLALERLQGRNLGVLFWLYFGIYACAIFFCLSILYSVLLLLITANWVYLKYALFYLVGTASFHVLLLTIVSVSLLRKNIPLLLRDVSPFPLLRKLYLLLLIGFIILTSLITKVATTEISSFIHEVIMTKTYTKTYEQIAVLTHQNDQTTDIDDYVNEDYRERKRQFFKEIDPYSEVKYAHHVYEGNQVIGVVFDIDKNYLRNKLGEDAFSQIKEELLLCNVFVSTKQIQTVKTSKEYSALAKECRSIQLIEYQNEQVEFIHSSVGEAKNGLKAIHNPLYVYNKELMTLNKERTPDFATTYSGGYQLPLHDMTIAEMHEKIKPIITKYNLTTEYGKMLTMKELNDVVQKERSIIIFGMILFFSMAISGMMFFIIAYIQQYFILNRRILALKTIHGCSEQEKYGMLYGFILGTTVACTIITTFILGTTLLDSCVTFIIITIEYLTLRILIMKEEQKAVNLTIKERF